MILPRLQPAKPGALLFAPLIGTVLLVGFFLAYGRSFVVQPGIAVVPPPSPFLVAPSKGATVVSIVSGETTRIFYRDRVVTLEELSVALAAVPASDARTLILRADRGTSYETVLAVANRAVEKQFTVILAGSSSR
ncbi:MAG: hypothetical protein JSR82_11135 [Verrucomicrobia bacterium]|nr:hypothetical protein [Verrucomicrobiota bacterium]